MTERLLAAVALLAALLPAAAGALPPIRPGEAERPAETALPGDLAQVGFEQKLGAALPLATEFTDEYGRAVTLGSYYGRRPVVLAFVYHRCPMLCGLLQNGIVGTLKALAARPGRDFDLVVVSFDARDQASDAAAKKAEALSRYGKPETADGWHYLVGRQASIDALTQAVGFRTLYDERNQQFAHASGLVLTTADGRVSRYLYGVEFAPRDMKLALVEASEGKIGGLTEQLLLLCFSYDAKLGKYSAATMTLLRLGAVLTVLVLAFGLLWMAGRDRRARRATAGGMA